MPVTFHSNSLLNGSYEEEMGWESRPVHSIKGSFLSCAVLVVTVEVILLCSTAVGGLGELRMSAVPPEMKQVHLNVVKLQPS